MYHDVGYYADIVASCFEQALSVLRKALPAIGLGLTGLSVIHLRSKDRSKIGSMIGLVSGLGLLGLSTVEPEEAIAAVKAMIAAVMQ